MLLVLMTWLCTTAVSAFALGTLMVLQRLLVGPASGRRSLPVVPLGTTRPVPSDVRQPQAA